MQRSNANRRARRLRAGAMAALSALVLCACQPAAERANQAYASHAVAFEAGEIETAHRLILEAIAARDDISDYWLALGRIEVRRNELSGAFAAYSRALELDRRSVEAIQALAEISLLAREYDEAGRYADQLLTIDPTSLGGLVVKGFVALEDDELREATRLADAALAINRDDEGSLILKARTLAATKNHDQGIALLELRIQIAGATPGLLGELKTQYQATDDLGGLKRTYARLLALQADNQDVRLDYAALLFKTDEERAAIALLGEGLDPHRSDAAYADRIVGVWNDVGGAAVTAQDAARFAQAFQDDAKVSIARYAVTRGFDQVAEAALAPIARSEVDAANAEAAAVYAFLLERRQVARPALAQAEKVLAFDPANQTALRVRGRLLLNAGRTEQALRDALKLVHGQPRAAENHILLARVYARRGEVNLASRAYREAYRVAPRNQSLVQEYLVFLKSSRDFETARWLTQDFKDSKASRAGRMKLTAELCRTGGTTDACDRSG